jgi:nucleoside-diphosphate-sugar epimerase
VDRRIDHVEQPGTLVIGAASAVARYLLEQPAAAPGWWLAVSRSGPPVRLDDGVLRMRSEDGGNLPAWARGGIRHVVHLAPLWALLPYLESLEDVPLERVVACSSTRVITRRDAAGGYTDSDSRRIAEAEEALRAYCAARGIELVILRPTLIYAPGEDRNVERIARLVRRFGVFPVAGRGTGRRQPVHAEDVAHAAHAALRSPVAAGRCYTVSGAEVLTYREMVERVFRASGRRPRIVSIPVAPYRLALRLLWVFGERGIDPGAADRMDQDLSLGHDDAARDLAFRPRPFMGGPIASLPAE